MVGAPIPAKQISSPSKEDVEKLHAKYVRHLERLYKEHNPYPDVKLVIDWKMVFPSTSNCYNDQIKLNRNFLKYFLFFANLYQLNAARKISISLFFWWGFSIYMNLTSCPPNVERVLQTAEQFPIFLWQLSLLAKVMCHPIYIESFQREPPIKIYRARDGGHKKVLSPISRLIPWIMEADWERRRKEHWSFPLNFIFSKLCIFLDLGQERKQKYYLRLVRGSPTLKCQCSVFCLVFWSALQTASWHLRWKKPSNKWKTRHSS